MSYTYFWGVLAADAQPSLSPFWREATIRQFGGRVAAPAANAEELSLEVGASGLRFFHDVRHGRLLPGLPGEGARPVGPGYPESQFQPGRK